MRFEARFGFTKWTRRPRATVRLENRRRNRAAKMARRRNRDR